MYYYFHIFYFLVYDDYLYDTNNNNIQNQINFTPKVAFEDEDPIPECLFSDRSENENQQLVKSSIIIESSNKNKNKKKSNDKYDEIPYTSKANLYKSILRNKELKRDKRIVERITEISFC